MLWPSSGAAGSPRRPLAEVRLHQIPPSPPPPLWPFEVLQRTPASKEGQAGTPAHGHCVEPRSRSLRGGIHVRGELVGRALCCSHSHLSCRHEAMSPSILGNPFPFPPTPARRLPCSLTISPQGAGSINRDPVQEACRLLALHARVLCHGCDCPTCAKACRSSHSRRRSLRLAIPGPLVRCRALCQMTGHRVESTEQFTVILRQKYQGCQGLCGGFY